MNSNFRPILGCFTIIGVIFTILGVIVAIVALFKPAAITVVLQGILPEPTPVIIVVPSPTPVLAKRPAPTNTPEPSSTPTRIPLSTNTPTPTLTNTAIPTPTPIPNTPPGAVLNLGQTWRAAPMELTAIEFKAAGWNDCPTFYFKFYNGSEHDIFLTIRPEKFTMVDNLGRIYEATDTGTSLGGSGDYEVKRGDFLNFFVWFHESVTSEEITSLTIIANKVSSISNAKWQVEIFH